MGTTHLADKLTAKKGGLHALKRENLKFTIDASEPAKDEIFDIVAFVSTATDSDRCHLRIVVTNRSTAPKAVTPHTLEEDVFD